jgi:hypothetical protein
MTQPQGRLLSKSNDEDLGEALESQGNLRRIMHVAAATAPTKTVTRRGAKGASEQTVHIRNACSDISIWLSDTVLLCLKTS